HRQASNSPKRLTVRWGVLLFVPCIHALFYSIREFNLKKPCNLAIAGLFSSCSEQSASRPQ
ncbi:hypothetical protein, partial [Limnohabitans sp.]